MLKTFLVIFGLLIAGFCLLSVRVIVKKNGRLRSMHISDSKAMRDRGIGCVQSQDRAARRENVGRIKVNEL